MTLPRVLNEMVTMKRLDTTKTWRKIFLRCYGWINVDREKNLMIDEGMDVVKE